MLDNGRIEATDALDAAAFEIDVSAGTVRSVSGWYICGADSQNSLEVSETPDFVNEIGFDGSDFVVGYQGAYDYFTLRYNNQSGQERFRFYKNYSQQAVQLYMRVTGILFAEMNITFHKTFGTLNTAESKAKIEAARDAYDALTDAQKALVENYDVLTAAEDRYAELKAAAETPDTPTEPTKPQDPADPDTPSGDNTSSRVCSEEDNHHKKINMKKGAVIMKKMKIVLSLILSVLLAFSVFIAAFAAENEIVLSGTAGENVRWTLTSDGLLTVSGSGPILDDTLEEVDEGGSVTTTIMGSIGMSLSDYYDTLTVGLDAGEAARVRVNMVKEIVVEEGITEIPSCEFDNVCPRKVTLPSTLETFGYSAFDGTFTEEVIVNSVKVPYVQFYAAAYENGAEPYADREAAIEDYIARCRLQENYEYDLIPLELLRTRAEVVMNGENAWWNDCSDEEKAEYIERYNDYLGTDETELEALVPAALAALNERYGTAYRDATEIFTLETDEFGFTDLLIDDTLQAKMNAENEEIYNNSRLVPIAINFGDDEHTFYGWLTVTAPAGGQIEKDCKTSGVNFNALEGVTVPAQPEEDPNTCQFCGRDHTGSLWQRIIWAFHKVLYFFAHLFGRK